MAYEDVLVETAGGIGTITLNRPSKLNALTSGMRDSLARAVEDIERDDEVRVIIVTGAGRGFCAGADLAGFEQKHKEYYRGSRWAALQPVGFYLLPLRRAKKPVIAAINGVAAGAGVSLALLCDIRLAAQSAALHLAFTRRGLSADCGSTYTLPRLIGTSKALELLLTGAVLSAAEAAQLGIVSKAVPDAELMAEARQLAQRIAEGPPVANALIKHCVYQGLQNDLEEHLYLETYALNMSLTTEDFQEGLKAFTEKRPPRFRGK